MDITMQSRTAASIDDADQLVSVAQGNPTAFGALYDRYVHAVYRYHYSRVGEAGEAEDLTAQTFLAALEALPRYRGRGQFSAWLFQIARSKAMDYFRRRRPQVSLENAEGRSNQSDLLAQIVEGDDLRRLSRLIAGLPEPERELLRLRYVADLTFAEMASVLGKTEQSVKKSVYRLLERLHGRMEA
jgi:RNA polymerase sigma-70 factor (ECF subfamily)